MIDIGPETPRWIRELDRYLAVKSLLFLDGNILDLVAYPVVPADGMRSYWTQSSLPDFFRRYLTGLGYEIVGLFDPVDGLDFVEEAMAQRFQAVLQSTRAIGTGDAATPSPSARILRRERPGDSLATPEPVIRQIAQVLANRSVPAAFVVYLSSRLLSAPDRLGPEERALFTRILKCSLAAESVYRESDRWKNVLILVCDKLNDLPAFLYLDNPRSRCIHLDRPAPSERGRFFRTNYPSFFGVAPTATPSDDSVGLFTALTDGMTQYELLSLVDLSNHDRVPIDQLRSLVARFKYGIAESDWDKLDRQRLGQAEAHIRGRIKGQDAAVQRMLDLIKRAALGLEAGSTNRSQRPRGVLFFAGPTGVGKTEMAKALAELLFGEADRLVRFDMSEFAAAHADQKLLGAPPGYVGYEAGGKLTNAVKEQPFAVLLFDEIEKAHGSIFDKFLQILDDGRLTDGLGETVYFSECVIIFTSNLGTVAKEGDGARAQLISPDLPFARLQAIILEAILQHFNLTLGRPEILNRFGDNFVVFDFIRPPVDEQILDALLEQLQRHLQETRGVDLRWSAPFHDTLARHARQRLGHGGRGIRNVLDTVLVNPLASILFDRQIAVGSRVEVTELIDFGEQAPRRFDLRVEVLAPSGVSRA